MFCPNCGTQNPETAATCSKCNFALKGAAAPKFKGTMLMMNQPAAGGAPAAPRPAAGAPAPPGAPPVPTPPPGGAAPPPSKLKGTMVGVAPPVPPVGGGQFGTPPPQPAPNMSGSAPPAFGEPPPPAQQFSPPNQGGQGVNPLGGTMAVDQMGAFGAFGAPPPAAGGPPPDQGFGAPPPRGGFGGPPPGGQYGAPPDQGFGGPPMGQPGGIGGGVGAPPPNQGMGGFDAAAGQAYGGMQQGMQQGFGGPPAPGGYGAPGAPMQPGAAGDINTTTPLIFGVLAFLSCWPIGLFIGTFSLLAALKVKKLKEQGQLEAARASAASAKKLAFITWGVGFLIWVVLSVLYFVVFATAAAGS